MCCMLASNQLLHCIAFQANIYKRAVHAVAFLPTIISNAIPLTTVHLTQPSPTEPLSQTPPNTNLRLPGKFGDIDTSAHQQRCVFFVLRLLLDCWGLRWQLVGIPTSSRAIGWQTAPTKELVSIFFSFTRPMA